MGRYDHGGITDQTGAANKRLRDARTLRSQQRWRGAMYLMGYAVECRLKVRLMEKYNVRTLDQLRSKLAQHFGKKENDIDVYTHRIGTLFEYTEALPRMFGSCDGQTYRSAHGQCTACKVNWRYAPDDGRKEECDEFFDAAELMLRFLRSNI